MKDLLEFLHHKYFVENWPVPDKDADWALRAIEGDVIQFLLKADQRQNVFTKKLSLSKVCSNGFVESFEVTFVGSIYNPLVSNVTYKSDLFSSRDFDKDKVELAKKILVKSIEETISITFSAIVRLCFQYVSNSCKKSDYRCEVPIAESSWVCALENIGLLFDHNDKPEILPFHDPYIYGSHYLPKFANIEFTSYGDDVGFYTVSIYEIQKTFLKTILPG